MEIPSLNEIMNNLDLHIDEFINYISQPLPVIKSIAPVLGIKIEDDDTFVYNNVILRTPNLAELEDIAMIHYNSNRDLYYYEQFYRVESPILIMEQEFNWNPNPNDYSVEKNYKRLNTTCLNKFGSILSSLRLSTDKPDQVGIGLIFHKNKFFTTFESFRTITEDPLPNFKPIIVDGKPIKRDEFFYPLQPLSKDILELILSKMNKLETLLTNEENYFELFYAIKLYGKHVEEYDNDWILLDLVKSLEALGNFQNGISKKIERCQSANKIIKALSISEEKDKKIIEEAYKIRSMRAAHSPKDISINSNLLLNLERLNNITIKNFLKNYL